MDILTLAQLNKLKKSGGVGYTTKEVLLDGVFEWGETFSIMTNITDLLGDSHAFHLVSERGYLFKGSNDLKCKDLG